MRARRVLGLGREALVSGKTDRCSPFEQMPRAGGPQTGATFSGKRLRPCCRATERQSVEARKALTEGQKRTVCGKRPRKSNNLTQNTAKQTKRHRVVASAASFHGTKWMYGRKKRHQTISMLLFFPCQRICERSVVFQDFDVDKKCTKEELAYLTQRPAALPGSSASRGRRAST